MKVSSSMWACLAALSTLIAACADGYGISEMLEIPCVDAQCGWLAEQGGVERTASWHPKDYAFSLTGNPSQISRTLPVTQIPNCLRIEYVGDVAANAELTLMLDFNDDGTNDVSARLPTAQWKRQQLVLRAPADYRRLRLRLLKTGDGAAKLAQFSVYPEQSCDFLPATTLQNGAECSLDATCSSNRCVLGHCATCGLGGCIEGEACRSGEECLDGDCAAGVCRACAKQGTCATTERCSNARQCASNSCISGSVPSMTAHPQRDAVCGDCDAASDCASGHCVLGRCSVCATDADCSDGLSCRYLDLFDALVRGCAPKLSSLLPRGALCERDADCDGGRRCGSPDGRAKRCGIACGRDDDCAPSEACIAPGAQKLRITAQLFSTTPHWSEQSGRVSTCWPLAESDRPCELHQQCPSSSYFIGACCAAKCTTSAANLDTGECYSGWQLY